MSQALAGILHQCILLCTSAKTRSHKTFLQEPHTCGKYGANSTSYPCQEGYKYVPESANNTSPNSTTCCKWIPTCLHPSGTTGEPFTCRSEWLLRSGAATITDVGIATCCVSVILSMFALIYLTANQGSATSLCLPAACVQQTI